MTKYTGLYVQRLSDRRICSVQVTYSADPENIIGVEMSMDPERYINEKANPPIDNLPDLDEYYANKSGVSPIIINLLKWTKGHRMTKNQLGTMQQLGFIFPNPRTGDLELTVPGKEALEYNIKIFKFNS